MGWVWGNHRVLQYSEVNHRVVTTPRAEGERTGHGSPKLERVMERVMERAT